MLKGVGVGMAVGSAAAAACKMMIGGSSRKCFKKNAAKCMKTMSGMLDDVQSMMK